MAYGNGFRHDSGRGSDQRHKTRGGRLLGSLHQIFRENFAWGDLCYFGHLCFITRVQHNEPVRNFQRLVTHMALPLLSKLWFDDQGQDIAEYAVTLAVILVIVAGTIRLVASNTNVVLWSSSSSIQ
jgi:hypothetical protein